MRNVHATGSAPNSGRERRAGAVITQVDDRVGLGPKEWRRTGAEWNHVKMRDPLMESQSKDC